MCLSQHVPLFCLICSLHIHTPFPHLSRGGCTSPYAQAHHGQERETQSKTHQVQFHSALSAAVPAPSRRSSCYSTAQHASTTPTPAEACNRPLQPPWLKLPAAKCPRCHSAEHQQNLARNQGERYQGSCCIQRRSSVQSAR